MLVLGIDPGIATTGIAFVKEEKSRLSLIHAEAITTSASLSSPIRLFKLHQTLSSLISRYHPDVLSLENLFFGTNAKTALTVGQARGVVQLTLAQNNIPVVEYTPLQVKMALTGYGRADKNQIQQMVKQILQLPQILTPDDVSDAAAIALTHCFTYKMTNLKSKM